MDQEGVDIALIGGTQEARRLAARLAGGVRVFLPANERRPHDWPVPVARLPQDAADLAECIGSGTRLLVDASHPFDVRASRLAAHTAKRAGIAVLRLERPAWQPGRRDRWVSLRTGHAAVHHVPRGARVFVATGREGLRDFAALKYVYVFSRQVSPHDDRFPLPRGRFLPAGRPFTARNEAALFRRLGIDWLILRNAGGQGGWPKLAAARQLGLPVAMIARPRLPAAPVVRDVESALERIAAWRT